MPQKPVNIGDLQSWEIVFCKLEAADTPTNWANQIEIGFAVNQLHDVIWRSSRINFIHSSGKI